jgi:hypothetical protein
MAREAAEEEADRLRKAEPAPRIGAEQFLAWRSPRKVTEHPTPLDNPLWHWLVRTRWGAYSANRLYAGPSSSKAGPMWCFERFGKSETALPDGRVVHIGGEHEDYYDPDFYIYNDVTIIAPNGEITILGYPLEDFPPTDYHSATLVGNDIFIIGRLGYPQQSVRDTTPVFRLELDSMRIFPVETSGMPPGWIFRHTATLADDGKSILVSGGQRWIDEEAPICENIDSWSLALPAGEWHRLSKRGWQHWIVRRTDRKFLRIWDVRQELWHRDHAHLGFGSCWRYDDEPDFGALAQLYRLDQDTTEPVKETTLDVFTVVIDSTTVRFKEDQFWIEAIVEGRLRGERLHALQGRTLELLSRLEASDCEIVEAAQA